MSEIPEKLRDELRYQLTVGNWGDTANAVRSESDFNIVALPALSFDVKYAGKQYTVNLDWNSVAHAHDGLAYGDKVSTPFAAEKYITGMPEAPDIRAKWTAKPSELVVVFGGNERDSFSKAQLLSQLANEFLRMASEAESKRKEAFDELLASILSRNNNFPSGLADRGKRKFGDLDPQMQKALKLNGLGDPPLPPDISRKEDFWMRCEIVSISQCISIQVPFKLFEESGPGYNTAGYGGPRIWISR